VASALSLQQACMTECVYCSCELQADGRPFQLVLHVVGGSWDRRWCYEVLWGLACRACACVWPPSLLELCECRGMHLVDAMVHHGLVPPPFVPKPAKMVRNFLRAIDGLAPYASSIVLQALGVPRCAYCGAMGELQACGRCGGVWFCRGTGCEVRAQMRHRLKCAFVAEKRVFLSSHALFRDMRTGAWRDAADLVK
jgi:hypothetical protein